MEDKIKRYVITLKPIEKDYDEICLSAKNFQEARNKAQKIMAKGSRYDGMMIDSIHEQIIYYTRIA